MNQRRGKTTRELSICIEAGIDVLAHEEQDGSILSSPDITLLHIIVMKAFRVTAITNTEIDQYETRPRQGR